MNEVDKLDGEDRLSFADRGAGVNHCEAAFSRWWRAGMDGIHYWNPKID